MKVTPDRHIRNRSSRPALITSRSARSQITSTSIHEKYGMKPRFREPWDVFPDLQSYNDFTAAWITEAMRCPAARRIAVHLLFLHCVGPIDMFLQTSGFRIVQHIQVYQSNQKPSLSGRTLQIFATPLFGPRRARVSVSPIANRQSPTWLGRSELGIRRYKMMWAAVAIHPRRTASATPVAPINKACGTKTPIER